MGRSPRPRTSLPPLAGLTAGAAVTLGVMAAVWAVAPPGSTWVPAGVDQVLLFSTEARVFRTATVPLTGAGAQDVALADLPSAVIADSVRVESSGAEVVRVAVIPSRGELPRQAETRELVAKIEAVTDKLRDLSSEQSILDAELRFIRALTLRREPDAQAAARAPAEGLFADAWKRTLTWMEGRSLSISARLQAVAAEQRAQHKELHALQVKAQKVDPDSMSRLVSRVVATLRGRPGRHQVVVSYRVSGVRWVPAYDLRYVPDRRLVEATYYAVVNQSTGEDWQRARMQFSTAEPTQLLAIPELPTWTLGRRRDFTPQPRERVEPAPIPWVAPAPPLITDPVLEQLRQVLGEGDGRDKFEDRDGESDDDSGVVSGQPVEKTPASRGRRTTYDFKDELVDGALVRPDTAKALPTTPKPVMAPPPPPAPAEPAPAEESESMDREAPARPSPSYAPAGPPAQRISSGEAERSLQEAVPWTDVGYQPPVLDPDLPAAAAQGYRFTLYAPGRHSVPATGAQQRVPLLRERLKVKPIYRVLPGLSKKAYLVAEVHNSTGRPILRGAANLFTGAMFSGRSWINTALPGKTIKLPLGVDDAIKVERHLRQKTVVQGVVFKDDITEYTVQIEIANHHRYPISVEVEDQVPVTLGRKIEVKGFSASPKMEQPDETGKLRWEGTIRAGAVQKLIFNFQLVRPREWEVRQHDG